MRLYRSCDDFKIWMVLQEDSDWPVVKVLAHGSTNHAKTGVSINGAIGG